MDVPTTTNAARLSRFMLLAITAYFCFSLALWAQTSDSQSDGANKSWTASTESNGQNAEPLRTIETHTQSGNRTLDKQMVQRRAMDGGSYLTRTSKKKRCKWTMARCEPLLARSLTMPMGGERWWK
jgi:hypothetical protein